MPQGIAGSLDTKGYGINAPESGLQTAQSIIFCNFQETLYLRDHFETFETIVNIVVFFIRSDQKISLYKKTKNN